MGTFVADDLVKVSFGKGADGKERFTVLAWGDPVEVLEASAAGSRVRIAGPDGTPVEGVVKRKIPTQDRGVLKFTMVDVQQGDGLVMETPSGKVVLVDGGDNQLFARYCAARFRGTTEDAPKTIDAIVITHGDADHFAGLSKIRDSEKFTAQTKGLRKRLFVKPLRVFHNGLAKGPTTRDGATVAQEAQFGATVDTPDGPVVVDLVDDLRKLPEDRLNAPFKTWQKTLLAWSERVKPDDMLVRRLRAGDHAPFDFLREAGAPAEQQVKVEVLGPIEDAVSVGGAQKPGLRVLRSPGAAIEFEDGDRTTKSLSASHTINGHSVVLRVTIGNVRFLLTGDLNQQAMERLKKVSAVDSLAAEIAKVPHHGSGDFDLDALKEVGAAVWLISSGDESARKEFIHPRATLVGSLGRASRARVPLIFCTELAAFFAAKGDCTMVKAPAGKNNDPFYGFERTNYGIIHVRTDGERVLVFTHSGQAGLKEAYRFTVDAEHKIKFKKIAKR
jgi:beta-lactamase superfamily II metal-dependent hydrolase